MQQSNRSKLINALGDLAGMTYREAEQELINIAQENTGILNDKQINELAMKGMISPYEPYKVRKVNNAKVLSYGQEPYGYTFRLESVFQVFTLPLDKFGLIDPKAFDPKLVREHRGDFVIIPPHGFVLATTVEYWRIPVNVTTVCVGKSTYARCNGILNVTPFEAGWEGQATIEFSNPCDLPMKLYAGEGAGQILFFQGQPPALNYADNPSSAYQGQVGITHAAL